VLGLLSVLPQQTHKKQALHFIFNDYLQWTVVVLANSYYNVPNRTLKLKRVKRSKNIKWKTRVQGARTCIRRRRFRILATHSFRVWVARSLRIYAFAQCVPLNTSFQLYDLKSARNV
jgi:hypothetical protein